MSRNLSPPTRRGVLAASAAAGATRRDRDGLHLPRDASPARGGRGTQIAAPQHTPLIVRISEHLCTKTGTEQNMDKRSGNKYADVSGD